MHINHKTSYRTKTVYLSANANITLKNYVRDLGWEINEVCPTDKVYTEISTHPDIYMCKLGCRDEDPIFFGNIDELGRTYPDNVKFNAACTGRFFIHNLKYTSNSLLTAAGIQSCEADSIEFHPSNIKSAESQNSVSRLTAIHIPQGYGKCSIAIIDETSIITSDVGIVKALNPYPIDVLLIEKGHIRLPGFDYGFIGGCCGRLGDEIVFNGNLSAHPDFKAIKEFIISRGLGLKYFEEYELEDIGSIIGYKE